MTPNQNMSGFPKQNRGSFRKLAVLIVAIASLPQSALWAQVPVHTVVATPAVGSEPLGVVVSPDGTHAYITDESNDLVTVVQISQ